MFSYHIGNRGAHTSDNLSEDSEDNSIHNRSATAPLGRGGFLRSSLRAQAENKIQRVSSLIADANYEETYVRTRNKPEHKHVRLVIFPDDTLKILWDILILA